MIDKINGQKYYEHAKIHQEKRKSVDSSEFYLNLEKQGVIYEKSGDKKKSAKAEEKKESSNAQKINASSDIKVEISREGREKAQQRENRIDFSEKIRQFAQTAVAFLNSLWSKIWNGPVEEIKVEFPEILEERMEKAQDTMDVYPGAQEMPAEYLLPGPEPAAQPSYTQEEIRAIFRRGNQKEIENFLSNNGERRLAKNSDLLTQYDRRGTIVGVDRSDKELILYGNKNEIKL